MSFFPVSKKSSAVDWATSYKSPRADDNASLQDAQVVMSAIRNLGLPVPSVWLGTQDNPLVFSPSEFLQNGGQVTEPLNWQFSWVVRTEAPPSERDPGKEEFKVADFVDRLRACGASTESLLSQFAADVLNAQADPKPGERRFTAIDGQQKLLELNPEAARAMYQALIRKAQG